MILVAGGSGTLGSRLVKRLRDRSLSVRVLTRDRTRAAHLAALGADVVCGDIRELPDVRRAAAGAVTIVGAAHGFGGTGGSTPATVDRLGNRHLVDAAKEVGAAVVLVSVVGASSQSPLELFRAKHDAEEFLRRSGVSWTIVRATAFLETWIGILSEPLRTSGRGLVFGHGTNPINFVSADAVAALLERAVLDPTLRSQTLEIGGPANVTLTEFVALLTARHGGSVPARHVPRIALRAFSILLRPVRPAFAARAAAAVVLDTRDMTFDARPLRMRFPDLPDIGVRDLLASYVP